MTVFSFRIFYINDMAHEQYRYVVANTEEEAIDKLEAYREQHIKNGFADFTYNMATVEIENIIN